MSKFSQYNIRIPLSDKSDILYNALSDRFIAIKHDLELQDVSDLPKTVAILLQENGMLTADDSDERSEAIDRWKQEASSSSALTIIINPTLGVISTAGIATKIIPMRPSCPMIF